MTLSEECRQIDAFFKAHKIKAATDQNRSFMAGKAYASVGLKLGDGALISKIESRSREISELLTQIRQKETYVRIRTMPLQLEIPHPAPEPIGLDMTQAKPFAMLLGQSYHMSGSVIEAIELPSTPHILISGTTGSGKSTLLASMLTSLLLSTTPDDLDMVLIDLKNEDMQPFLHLPHVVHHAVSPRSAQEALFWLFDELSNRVEKGAQGKRRILCVIDELAALTRMKELREPFAQILGLGRSKKINVIAATQKPTSQVVGPIAKANFTCRLVGRVMSRMDAEVASGMTGTGAEFLPGNGSFLRVEGVNLRRFQAFMPGDELSKLSAMRPFNYVERLNERIGQIINEWIGSGKPALPCSPSGLAAYELAGWRYDLASRKVTQIPSAIKPISKPSCFLEVGHAV